MTKSRENRYITNGKHTTLKAGSVSANMESFQDKSTPIYILSNWKITKENKNTYLLFKMTKGYDDDRFVESNILYDKGSPKFGCAYNYIDCEQYNYSIIYNYKTRIIFIEKDNLYIKIRDKYGYLYYISKNNSNLKKLNI